MICNCQNCEINSIFFKSFKDPNDLEKYCIAKKEIAFPAGKRFIKQGDKITSFKYLKEGLIKLHRKNKSGGEQIISFGKPMDFVSIQNVFSEKKYSYSVTTLEDSIVCMFELPTIVDLIKTNGAFAKSIIETTNRASNRILSNSLDMISKSMYGKVASVILFFQEKVYLTYGFDLPVSRKEIAQYTGLSIETVIRVISEFRRDGLIKVYGKRIEIIDKEGLASIYEHS
jgi:CRP/FNR family transcriptional regulator